MTSQVLSQDAIHSPSRNQLASRRSLPQRCTSQRANTGYASSPAATTWLRPQAPQLLTAARQQFACSAASTSAEQSSGVSSLTDLELQPILNAQGFILPEQPADSPACVFAVFDDKKKLQYIGFGKALRQSLRTLLSRRPDKAYYYKVQYLSALDQQAMMEIRTQWFDECGGQPPGNKLALERALWQQPAEAFTISDRGKRAAAEEMVKEALDALRLRNSKETFIPDQALLDNGKVDFLPGVDMTPEELARQQQVALQARSALRTVETTIGGIPTSFDIKFISSHTSNAGYFFDVVVTHGGRESVHRVIVGREYYEPYGLEPQQTVEVVFEFMLQHEYQRQTEGLLGHSQFSVNYFSCGSLEQYDPSFVVLLAERAGVAAPLERGDFWRFNRMHDYGPALDNMESLSIAMDKTDKTRTEDA